MQAQRAILLRRFAADFAAMLSNPDRPKNPGEIFRVVDIVVLSEMTAAIKMKKDTGKLALGWAYWVPRAYNPEWRGFCVTYQHLTGMEKVADLLHDIEQHNYWLNFKGENGGQEKQETYTEAAPPG